MKYLVTAILVLASQQALANGPGIHVSIPTTGSTPTPATLTVSSEPKTVNLSCEAGWQAENFYTINCVNHEGAPWLHLDIYKLENPSPNGILRVDGMQDRKLDCRGNPGGPVECVGL